MGLHYNNSVKTEVLIVMIFKHNISHKDSSELAECNNIPLYDIYKEITKNVQNMNVWSFEYIASTFTKLLKMLGRCRENEKSIEASAELKNIAENISKYYSEEGDILSLTLRANQYLQEVGRALCGLGYDVREIEVELSYRGSIGVSSGFGQLLFEWGISFDPYLNLPYIPASSIKGAVRASYRYLCLKHFKDVGICNDKVENIFGSSSKGAGLVMFTDAYPVRLQGNAKYILIPDVVTPHYNSEELRYEKDVEPNPVVHLSINKGVVFKFLVCYRSRGDRKINYNEDLVEDPDAIHSLDDLKLIDKAIFLALGLGVGAKTLTGYSQFKIRSYRKLCRKR